MQEVEDSIERLFSGAAYADKYGGTVQETTLYGLTVAINEPVGVVGIVCPERSPPVRCAAFAPPPSLPFPETSL